MNNMPEGYKGLISFLGKALPDEFDAILFDLSEKGYPVIEQADWGSEDVNDVRKCMTDLIRSGKADDSDCVLNVIVPTKRKKLMKASFYFIKEGEKFLCAVALITELEMLIRMNTFFRKRLTVAGLDAMNEISMADMYEEERQITDPDEIRDMVYEFCPDPSELTPTERKELFMDVYDTGVFRIKGAIPKAAEAMGISEQTVYRYISDIKKHRK